MPIPDQSRYPPERVPPGQFVTEKFPVLHQGKVPDFDPATWDFRVHGDVENPLTFTHEELTHLDTSEIVTDIHCVTTWSKLDTRWEGVPVARLLEMARPGPGATYAIAEADGGYTANVLLEDLYHPHALVAWRYDGRDLEPEHGWPLRLVLPQRYFWKSAKWLRGLRVQREDEPGFWEVRGYHNNADYRTEERYGSGREPLVDPGRGTHPSAAEGPS